jgi:hypothetical protein
MLGDVFPGSGNFELSRQICNITWKFADLDLHERPPATQKSENLACQFRQGMCFIFRGFRACSKTQNPYFSSVLLPKTSHLPVLENKFKEIPG